MKLVAYDPYVQPARAAQIGVKLVVARRAARESDFITVHLPKTPETVGLIGDEALQQGQAVGPHRQRRARRDRRRGGAVRRAQGGPGRRRRPRRVRQGAVHRLARCSSSTTSSSPRTSVPPPTRRRRRPASPSPGRCASRSPASSCRTRSTSRAASSPRTCARGCRSPRSSADLLPRSPARSRAPRRRGARRDHRARRQGARALRAQGRLRGRRRRAGLVRQRPVFAQERGVEVRLTTSGESPGPPQRGHRARHPRRRRRGLGLRHARRPEARPEDRRRRRLRRRPACSAAHMAFFRYDDRPGRRRPVGRVLGEAGVNIAGMQVSRDAQGR